MANVVLLIVCSLSLAIGGGVIVGLILHVVTP